MNKLIFICFCFINLYGNSISNIIRTSSGSDEVIFTKQLMNISQKEISFNSKNDNIQNLFELALNENRITYSKFNNIELYNNLEKGDYLLLRCLK